MFRRGKRSQADIAEEIEAHIALEAEQRRIESNPGGAERAARLRFGNATRLREDLYERGRLPWWDNFVRDLRQALRLTRRSPGFSGIAVLTLALGIGANTAIFTILDAVMLKPLPYQDPDRLAMLWMDDRVRNDHEGTVSLLNLRDWRKQTKTFDGIAMFCGQTFLLGNAEGPPDRMRSARVPANFFSLMGVNPERGRVFSPEEERRGERLVVISHGLWLRRFGGQPTAIGSALRMDDRAYRVVGVMPKSFQFPFTDTEVWEPVTAHPYWIGNQAEPRSAGPWFALGRLRPGVTWEQAAGDLNRIQQQINAAHKEMTGSPGVRVVPLQEQNTGKIRQSLMVLFGAVAVVLLISCINTANLLMARNSARQREFAVRRALGAGRKRIAAQLLTESLVLSLAGAALGLAFAAAGVRALIAYGPHDIPRMSEAHFDAGVLAFTLAVSVFTALVSGAWPAFQSGAPDLKSRFGLTAAKQGTRGILVAGEFALALIILAAAGTLVHSFVLLQKVDPGFHPEHLLKMRVDLHVGKTPAQQVAYFENAVAHLGGVPGVRSAAAVGRFLRSYGEEPVDVENLPAPDLASTDIVAGPFFETAGIPLERGRAFTGQDQAGAPPVAIINEAMARRDWPRANPIGKRFRPVGDGSGPWITVVGVCGNMHRQGIEKAVRAQIFRPLAQNPDNEMDILVRTSGDAAQMAASIRAEAQSVDPGVARFSIAAVEREFARQTAGRLFNTSLIGLFSMLALLLSAVGIYGLLRHMVALRTHEIGLRMALGARQGTVLGSVLKEGMGLACAGVAVGMFGALGVTRVLAGMLYEVGPADPLSFAGSALILTAVAGVACWLPARQAARVDPMVALRQD